MEEQFQKCQLGGLQELNKQATWVPNAVTFDYFIQSPQNLIQIQLTCRGTSPNKIFFKIPYFLPELLHQTRKDMQNNNTNYCIYIFLSFISSFSTVQCPNV